jgi:hypothetical protein
MTSLQLHSLLHSKRETCLFLLSEGMPPVNGCRQSATAQNSGKFALFSECSLFIFFPISFMCLFIFLNKFTISFLFFSVYIPPLFLPKPWSAPHSENLLAFKIHLHGIIYSFDKVLFCLMFIFFNNKKPG